MAVGNHRQSIGIRSFEGCSFFFETKQEAENFYHYVKSYIIRYAFLMTDEALTTLALKVPDMSDYTSDNKLIDWSQDIDSQLQKLMSLSDAEFEYIKNTVQSVRA